MSKKDGRTRVLFVCIGNACRSPMAEAIARLDAPDAIEAFSAGLAPIGLVAPMTNQTLRKNRYWVEGLESKSISREVWEQAEIVINMSGRPRERAFREYSKVEDWEIEDPLGGDPGIYQQVFDKIRLRVAELAQECRQENAAVRGAERRARARLHPTSPIFVNLNRAYDGIAFNISEHGLALSSAMTFPDGPLHNMRIQFPGFQSWIEISGQIEWKSKSNKTVGVRFDGLTEEAYRQIRSWISSQASAGDFQEQTERICEERNPRMEIPNAPRPGNMIPGSPTSRSLALPVTPPKTYPETRKRSDKKAFQSRSKFARDQSYPGMPSPRWGDFAAIGVLVGLISLSIGWRAMRRDVRSEMREPVTQKAKVSSEAVRSGRPPSVSRIPIAPDPGEEKTGLQPRSMAPPFSEEHESIPNTSLRHQGQQVRSVKRPPANTNIKTPSRPVISVLAQGQTPKEPSRAAAIVNNPSVEKAEPQPVGSLPATPPHLEAPIAPPVILAFNPPTVDPKKIEGSTPPANHPAIPAKTTGAVAILADPYPSLRIPDRGVSKKQRQATSLQLGRLLSRVEPIYPEEAKQQGIQGTVKLHAIIGRQGSVEKLESVDGSPVLLAAAMKAVRQWRFTETLLAGQSVETEEDIAITFRLSNPTPPTN